MKRAFIEFDSGLRLTTTCIVPGKWSVCVSRWKISIFFRGESESLEKMEVFIGWMLRLLRISDLNNKVIKRRRKHENNEIINNDMCFFV